MKLLNMSGGSTKGAGIFGAAERLYELGYKPDVITGISVGSILALPLVLGKFNVLRKLILNMNLDSIFDKKPINDSGKLTITAYSRIISGKNSLGTQGNIVKLMKEVVTESEFNEYCNSDKTDIYLGAVNFNTGKKKYFRIKELNYSDYLSVVLASSSIPIYAEPVKIGNEYYFDGGVRDHIGSAWALESLFNITECISIYSRPEQAVLNEWKPDGLLSILQRTLDIMNIETSSNDQLEEEDLCGHKDIKLTQIFLPKILKSLYDTDRGRISELYKAGRDAVNELKLFNEQK